MVARRFRRPLRRIDRPNVDLPGSTPDVTDYLRTKGLWNDPGSGRFIRRGRSTAKGRSIQLLDARRESLLEVARGGDPLVLRLAEASDRDPWPRDWGGLSAGDWVDAAYHNDDYAKVNHVGRWRLVPWTEFDAAEVVEPQPSVSPWRLPAARPVNDAVRPEQILAWGPAEPQYRELLRSRYGTFTAEEAEDPASVTALQEVALQLIADEIVDADPEVVGMALLNLVEPTTVSLEQRESVFAAAALAVQRSTMFDTLSEGITALDGTPLGDNFNREATAQLGPGQLAVAPDDELDVDKLADLLDTAAEHSDVMEQLVIVFGAPMTTGVVGNNNIGGLMTTDDWLGPDRDSSFMAVNMWGAYFEDYGDPLSDSLLQPESAQPLVDRTKVSIVRHEYGHYIDAIYQFRLPNGPKAEQRGYVLSLWNPDDGGLSPRRLSRYAAFNENETLAELFTLISHPDYPRWKATLADRPGDAAVQIAALDAAEIYFNPDSVPFYPVAVRPAVARKEGMEDLPLAIPSPTEGIDFVRSDQNPMPSTAALTAASTERAALSRSVAQRSNTSVYPVDVLPKVRPDDDNPPAPGADNLAAVRGYRGMSGRAAERRIPRAGETIDIYRDLMRGGEHKRGFPDNDAFSVRLAASANGNEARLVTAATVGVELSNPRVAWAAAEKVKVEADPKNTRGVHAFLRGEVQQWLSPDEAAAIVAGDDWVEVTYYPGTQDFFLPDTRQRVIAGDRAIATNGKMFMLNPRVVEDAPPTPRSAIEDRAGSQPNVNFVRLVDETDPPFIVNPFRVTEVGRRVPVRLPGEDEVPLPPDFPPVFTQVLTETNWDVLARAAGRRSRTEFVDIVTGVNEFPNEDVAAAMYQVVAGTQRALRDAGIEQVVLYRGTPDVDNPFRSSGREVSRSRPDALRGGEVPVPSGVTSWTTSADTASRYGDGSGTQVVKAIVPADRILSWDLIGMQSGSTRDLFGGGEVLVAASPDMVQDFLDRARPEEPEFGDRVEVAPARVLRADTPGPAGGFDNVRYPRIGERVAWSVNPDRVGTVRAYRGIGVVVDWERDWPGSNGTGIETVQTLQTVDGEPFTLPLDWVDGLSDVVTRLVRDRDDVVMIGQGYPAYVDPTIPQFVQAIEADRLAAGMQPLPEDEPFDLQAILERGAPVAAYPDPVRGPIPGEELREVKEAVRPWRVGRDLFVRAVTGRNGTQKVPAAENDLSDEAVEVTSAAVRETQRMLRERYGPDAKILLFRGTDQATDATRAERRLEGRGSGITSWTTSPETAIRYAPQGALGANVSVALVPIDQILSWDLIGAQVGDGAGNEVLVASDPQMVTDAIAAGTAPAV